MFASNLQVKNYVFRNSFAVENDKCLYVTTTSGADCVDCAATNR